MLLIAGRPLAGLLEWIERSRKERNSVTSTKKCNWWVLSYFYYNIHE